MPKDPSKTYMGVLPMLIEFLAAQPYGAEFSYEKLAEQTGFTFAQVRTSLRHAHQSGRLAVPQVADQLGIRWDGLGTNAKLADRERLGRVARPPSLGTATEAIAAGSTGEIRLNGSAPREPVGEYLSTAPPAGVDQTFGFGSVLRELKDGALLLLDGHGELWKAVRI